MKLGGIVKRFNHVLSLFVFFVTTFYGCGDDTENSASEYEDALMNAQTEEAEITSDHGEGLLVPASGKLYHGVFPGDDDSGGEYEEDGITLSTLQSYENAVGKNVAWVYFSDNWYRDRSFPISTATWIRNQGAIPFIRLMLRSSSEQDISEPIYTLSAILAGDFDQDLIAWGHAASEFTTPLIVEWGTEVNGEWFSWNGTWNGKGTTGPALFRGAFRHIVRTISSQNASNISWAFHVGAEDIPEDTWNALENYYPGDDAVDWVGVSAYGALTPDDDEWTLFSDTMDDVIPRLKSMAPSKPLFVFEFGVTSGNSLGDPAVWADSALTDLIMNNRWPEVRGFSWWNEKWQNDDNPTNDTDLTVQGVSGLADIFKNRLNTEAVLDKPILSSP